MIDYDFLFSSLLFLYSALIVILLLIFIMHFLMPKAILDTYFKPPYFKNSEITFFSGIPYGYIRTVIFMRVLGFPKSGEKRGLSKVYTLAPNWYCISSRIVLFAFVVVFTLVLLSTALVGVDTLIFNE